MPLRLVDLRARAVPRSVLATFAVGALLVSCARSSIDDGLGDEDDDEDASFFLPDAADLDASGADSAMPADDGGSDVWDGFVPSLDAYVPDEDDAGETEDDAGMDAGARDAGADAGARDAGTDAGAVDAGRADSGVDAGPVDAGSDAGPRDAGTDAGTDSGTRDAGPAVECNQDSDCKNDCNIAAPLQCCSNNKCGCSWLPGAYCS